jgi:hypothetical protein
MSGFSNYANNINNIITFHTLAAMVADSHIQPVQDDCAIWAKRKAVLKNCKLSKTFRYKLKSSSLFKKSIIKKSSTNKLQKYTKRYNLRSIIH